MSGKKKGNSKKILLICACLALVSGGILSYYSMGESQKEPTQWEQYSPDHSPFAASFPSDPQESNEPLDIAGKQLMYYQVAADQADHTYKVGYLRFPKIWTWIGSKKLLNKTFTKMVENEPGIEKVLSNELTTHKGYSALAYQVVQNGKQLSGKLVIAGTTFYRVTVETPLKQIDKVRADAFLDSFSVQSY